MKEQEWLSKLVRAWVGMIPTVHGQSRPQQRIPRDGQSRLGRGSSRFLVRLPDFVILRRAAGLLYR